MIDRCLVSQSKQKNLKMKANTIDCCVNELKIETCEWIETCDPYKSQENYLRWQFLIANNSFPLVYETVVDNLLIMSIYAKQANTYYAARLSLERSWHAQ